MHKNEQIQLNSHFDKLVDGGASSPVHYHPLQILLEPFGFRPQNLQSSVFFSFLFLFW